MSAAKRKGRRGQFTPPSTPERSIRLKVLSEPDSTGEAHDASDAVAIVGGDDVVDPVDYTCGACGQLVAEGIERGSVVDVTIPCGGCGATNLAPLSVG